MKNHMQTYESFANPPAPQGIQKGDAGAPSARSDTMAMAIACLGGRKKWNGRVRGLFGLLRRDISIDSSGAVENGDLVFRETLRFDNGDEEYREWLLRDTPQGLTLEATGVKPLQPAKIENGFLAFKYLLSLNGLMVTYQDAFALTPNGNATNTGIGKLFGLPVLKVTVAEVAD